MIYLLMFIGGFLFGIITMCLFQINKGSDENA